MKKILVILIFSFPLSGFCQSFIFCPDIKTEAKQGFNNVKISIVFDDSRVYKQKRKEKCNKEEIFGEFVNCIKRTYSNMQITVLEEKMFYENPIKENITIKIKFKQYDATFYTGMYIANTKYDVKIYDYRNGENIIEESIAGAGNQFNALGFKSGKIASNSSFKEAFDKFVLMLDKLASSTNNQKSSVQKQSQQNDNKKSKADRLRELKQLLDEKIITQEEFDKEKKKILDEKE